MSEMIERVARALAEESWARMYQQDPNFMIMKFPEGEPSYVDSRWALYTSQARAAIEGMRELPPSVVKVLQMETEIGAYVCSNWSGGYSVMADYHNAMIDAALKDDVTPVMEE